jgi:hypothetical protein
MVEIYSYKEKIVMRQRNWRMVIGGFLLLVLALGFAFFMSSIASISTDPVEFMRLVGGASGTVGGLSLVLILVGLIGKKA